MLDAELFGKVKIESVPNDFKLMILKLNSQVTGFVILWYLYTFFYENRYNY